MRISNLLCLTLLMLFLFGYQVSFAENGKPIPATRDAAGNLPSDTVKTLAESYQSCNFKEALTVTMGKMESVIDKVVQIQKANTGHTPSALVAFSKNIDSFQVLGELEYNDCAIVSSSWLFKFPEKYNPQLFYHKEDLVDYFLKKDSQGQWKIVDARFKNEHIYYNRLP